MNKSFYELGISEPILKAIEDMGFETPTEVQSRAIPHILDHEDLIVMSKTGSGKTAVFGVSMLQLTDPERPGPQGLVLTPTRELAVQVDSDLKQLSKYLKHKTTAVFGQHSMNAEIQALNKGVTIVTGTPGRVYDHIQHGNLTTGNVRFLVLDEADRMLDMGFIDQVVRIIKTVPKDRVTLLFSATIPPEIKRICASYMKNPVTVEIESPTKTVDTINQCYFRVERNEKRTQLNRLLLIERPESCMIFCNTRIAVDQVQNFLSRKGYASEALHGEIPQAKRLKTIQRFKDGEFHILVATDVAARGLHVENLALVINYDVPVEKDSYIHRIGRTGRAGNAGRAVSLVTVDDIMTLYEIEEHIGALIEEAEPPTDAQIGEHRAEADRWIEANVQKPREPETGSRPNAREPRKKFSQPSSPQSDDNRRDRQALQPRPAGKPKYAAARPASNMDAKPARAPGKPAYAAARPVSGPVASKPAYAAARSAAPADASRSPVKAPGRSAYTGARPPQSRCASRGTGAAGQGGAASAAAAAAAAAGPQGKAPETRKPLLRRILERILGR